MVDNPTPAIRRDETEADRTATVVATIANDTTFYRGYGDSGRKAQHVQFNCPRCAHEHMVRQVDVSPEGPNGVTYWCLNPVCRYFVNDACSWATRPHPEMEPETPEIWTQTHECTVCGERSHQEIDREQYESATVEDGVVQTTCASFTEQQAGSDPA